MNFEQIVAKEGLTYYSSSVSRFLRDGSKLSNKSSSPAQIGRFSEQQSVIDQIRVSIRSNAAQREQISMEKFRTVRKTISGGL